MWLDRLKLKFLLNQGSSSINRDRLNQSKNNLDTSSGHPDRISEGASSWLKLVLQF